MSRENVLTLKQEKFCQYYVDIDGNASEAYRMAYDCTKMKQESVWRNAHALMQNIKVTSRIKEIREKRAKESEVKRETVERVLMDIITSDPNDLYIVDELTGKVKMKSPSQLPKRTRNALKKIQNKRGEVVYEKPLVCLVPGMDGKPIRMSISKVETEIKSVNFVSDLKIMRIRKNRTI